MFVSHVFHEYRVHLKNQIAERFVLDFIFRVAVAHSPPVDGVPRYRPDAHTHISTRGKFPECGMDIDLVGVFQDRGIGDGFREWSSHFLRRGRDLGGVLS